MTAPRLDVIGARREVYRGVPLLSVMAGVPFRLPPGRALQFGLRTNAAALFSTSGTPLCFEAETLLLGSMKHVPDGTLLGLLARLKRGRREDGTFGTLGWNRLRNPRTGLYERLALEWAPEVVIGDDGHFAWASEMLAPLGFNVAGFPMYQRADFAELLDPARAAAET